MTLQDYKLEPIEEFILQRYSEGDSYEELQKRIEENYPDVSYDKRKLGWKMGAIKNKMRCETQFQMGHRYAHLSFQEIIDSYNERLAKDHLDRYYEGKLAGREEMRYKDFDKHLTRNVLVGFGAATVMWLAIAAFSYTVIFL